MSNGKPATDTLRELENGQVVTDLTAAIQAVTDAAIETRKAGTITLTLKISPTGRGNVTVDAALAQKIPEHDRPGTTFFTTPDGQLVREDPSQPKLPLRSVEDGRAPPREVGDR